MQSRPAVICISSNQFTTDLGVLEGSVSGINWIKINDLDLIYAQRDWWPKHMQQQTVYGYETGPEAEAVWDQARKLGVKLISKAMKEQPVWAVMAGNFDYWNDEALRPLFLSRSGATRDSHQNFSQRRQPIRA